MAFNAYYMNEVINMVRTDNKVNIELTERELLEIRALLMAGESVWKDNNWSGHSYFQQFVNLLEEKIIEIDDNKQ